MCAPRWSPLRTLEQDGDGFRHLTLRSPAMHARPARRGLRRLARPSRGEPCAESPSGPRRPARQYLGMRWGLLELEEGAQARAVQRGHCDRVAGTGLLRRLPVLDELPCRRVIAERRAASGGEQDVVGCRTRPWARDALDDEVTDD